MSLREKSAEGWGQSGLKSKKKNGITIRSSAAEYLTFVAASGEGGVEAVYADENVWLTQKMMGVLYDVDVRTINYHLKKIFDDDELDESAVIRNFRITAVKPVDGWYLIFEHERHIMIIEKGATQ
jgi:hypothetical protein